MLDDGVYDIIVIDADEAGGGDVRLDVTILAGSHKGDVVSVHAAGLGIAALDCLGMPGTLTVADGAPTVRLDR